MEDEEDPLISAAPESTKWTRTQKIVFFSTCAGSFLCNSCISLPSPFLPKLNEDHQVSGSITGWMLGVASLTSFFITPVFGKLLPRIGFHFMFSFGLFFAGGCTVLFGTLARMPHDPILVDWAYITYGFLLRIMYAFGSSAFLIASMASIPLVFAGETTTVLGYIETVVGLGVMLGPAMGGALFKLGGFILPFATIGGLMVLCSVVIFFILPDVPQRHSSEADVADDKTLCQILTSPKMALALLLAMLAGVIWSSIDPILEPELRKKYGFTEEISSLTFLLLSVVYTIATPAIGKLLDSGYCCNGFIVIIFGLMLSVVNFLLAGPSPLIPQLSRPLWLLLVNIAVMGFSLSLIILPTMDIIFATDKDDLEHSSKTNSMLAGLWTAAYAIGDFAGPTFSGIVVENQSFGWAMTYYSITCAAVIVIIIVFKIYDKCKGEVLEGDEYERQALLQPPI